MPEHLFDRPGNVMQHDPKASAPSKHTPHLSYRTLDVHVGQGNSRDHQVEALVAERKGLAFGADKINVSGQLLPGQERRIVSVNADRRHSRVEAATDERPAAATPYVQYLPVILVDRREGARGVALATGHAQFLEVR